MQTPFRQTPFRKAGNTADMRQLIAGLCLLGACSFASSASANCDRPSDDKTLLWGDLHVHTSYSLDASVFGTLATPADAYRFAKGEPLTRTDGSTVQLDRPLDFVAVTEHAEWLDFTSICDSPSGKGLADCKNLLTNRSPANGSALFGEYVVTTITGAEPKPLSLCVDNPELCETNALSRWQSVQEQTDAAYEPCTFSTLHGYEWSHTPNFRHAHRNVIFRSDAVTKEAIDYIRFPTVEALWDELDATCRREDQCQALTIPHNTNMGNGISFELTQASQKSLQQRAQYERLIEITQEKGTSECLPPRAEDLSEDCGFELFLTRQSRPTDPEEFSEQEWQQMRSTYARSLVGRGLAFAPDEAPLRMGFIGSTDTHAATPGYVDEASWSGSALAGAGFDAAIRSNAWSAGGLVGVWAEENTREAIFDALAKREVYATSGPRIGLRFGLNQDDAELCSAEGWTPRATMGEVTQIASKPTFTVQVQADITPITSIEIIKLTHNGKQVHEEVIPLWHKPEGAALACIQWTDEQFDSASATLWYPRIKERPTPRWSAVQCAAVGRCDEFPQMDTTLQERAWGSPIWHIPATD